MNECFRDVMEFAVKHGHAVGTMPAVPADAVVDLRVELIWEEYDELLDAMDNNDLPAIAKEAMNLIYVVVGTMVAYGIDPVPCWRAVHESNLTKDGAKRGDDKVTKGDGYRPPGIAGILARQGPLDVACDGDG